MPSTRHAVLGIMLAAGVSLAVPAPGTAEGVQDEAKIAGRDRRVLPAGRRGLFHGHGQRPRAHAGRGQGPQHVAGLDRRQRPVLGRHDPRHLRRVRPAEDDLLASRACRYSARNRWNYLGPGQRALLRRGDGTRSRRASACGSTSAAPIARPIPFANEEKYPGRRDRRPRQATCRSAPTTASRPASWACACSPTPISTRRQRKALGSGALLHRSRLLQRQGSGPALPRRHVVRLLPCRAEPDRIRRPIPRTRSGRTSARRSARSTSGSTGSSPGKPNTANYMFQLVHTYRPGALDTSLVSTDNINNPRTMNAIYNLGPRLDMAKRWGRRSWPAASSTTSSSTTSSTTAR